MTQKPCPECRTETEWHKMSCSRSGRQGQPKLSVEGYQLSLAETAAQHTLHLVDLLNKAEEELACLRALVDWYERRENNVKEACEITPFTTQAVLDHVDKWAEENPKPKTAT